MFNRDMTYVRFPVSNVHKWQDDEIARIANERQISKSKVIRKLFTYALARESEVFLELTPEELQAIINMRRQ